MSPPTISIISSAARPENWMQFYESLIPTEIAFELVFVGPNAPDYQLPENFHFIKTFVKPAQCFEIAARNASGELLLWTADDSLYITKNPLDRLYEVYSEQKSDKIIVSSNYHLATGWDRFISQDLTSPRTALNGLLSSKLWHNIGGIDKNFIALGWDIDIDMRIHAMGGDIVMTDVYMDEKVEGPGKPRSRGSTLLSDHKPTDIARLHRLWMNDGVVHFDRTEPVERFSDVNILTRSQEPQGRWRYQSEFINRFMTSPIFYRLKNGHRGVRGRLRRFRFRNIPRYLRRLKPER